MMGRGRGGASQKNKKGVHRDHSRLKGGAKKDRRIELSEGRKPPQVEVRDARGPQFVIAWNVVELVSDNNNVM